MKLRLTGKLLIPLVLLVVFGLTASITVAYISARRGLEKTITSQIDQLSDSVASKVNTWMVRNKVDIENWSKMDVITNSFGSGEASLYRAAASAKMKNYIETYKIFSGMRVTNAQGVVIASSTAKNIGTVNVSKRDYFQNSMKGDFYISDPLISSTSGKPIVVISSPVKAAGQIKGVLYAVVDLGSFTEAHFDKLKVGKTGYVYMINKAGKALAYPPDKNEIMKLDFSKLDFGKKILEMKNGALNYEFKGVKKLASIKEIPVTGWIIAAAAPFNEVFESATKIRNLLIAIGFVITIVLFLGIVIMVSFFVVKPLNLVVEGLKDIAQGEGDLTMRLPDKREDEIGDLAHWFNLFIANLQKMILQISGNSETIKESSHVVSTSNKQINERLNHISDSFSKVSESCVKTNENMDSVAAAMDEASRNVDTVASGAEEMSSSVNEIAKNAERARATTDKTVQLANVISSEVKELGKAASAINQVTDTITDISDQTNLLALNATIEAARAGDAGKGFAVVASEIKGLAQQTAEAILEIRKKIESVQTATDNTVNRISEVTSVIGDSSDVVNSIASAVEEQSAATQEIASSASKTASGIQDVNQDVADSNLMIKDITTAIDRERNSVEDISFSAVEADINSEGMSDLASSQEELANRFKIGEKKFSIGKIKVAHLAWRTTLEAVIRGVKVMKPEDVTPHTECELGKWYEGPGRSLSSLDAYSEMGVWHEKVHQIAVDVVTLCNNGENEKAKPLMDDFREARENLFKKIDEIYLD